MSTSPTQNLTESEVDNEEIINRLTKNLQMHMKTDIESPESSNSDQNYVFTVEPNEHPDFKINKSDSASAKADDKDPDNDDKSDDSGNESDDDEIKLKDLEVTLTDEEKEVKKIEAEKHKNDGNNEFKGGDYEKSIVHYTKGLKVCLLSFSKERSVLYSNRAASKMKLDKNKEAIKDCSKAIELDPVYIKAYFRRAQCYEQTDSFDDSLADFKKILELEPQHAEALKAIIRLPPLIEQRNEKLKTEMMSKLKDLGNIVLKPFGLSTENFQLDQDPDTKGYSIKFQQNK